MTKQNRGGVKKMGMTIEEVEQWAKQNKFTIVADEWWDAAQDIISKYQKIVDIIIKQGWH